jgi:hypothetical protein
MTAKPSDDWNPCPPGELVSLAARLTLRRRLRFAAYSALALAATAGIAGGGWYAWGALSPRPIESQPGCGGCCPDPTADRDGCAGDHTTGTPGR